MSAPAAPTQELPNLPAAISLAYLRMWLGVLGLPLENLVEDGISITNHAVTVCYYATDPDGHYYLAGGEIAQHTITIPVTY